MQLDSKMIMNNLSVVGKMLQRLSLRESAENHDISKQSRTETSIGLLPVTANLLDC